MVVRLQDSTGAGLVGSTFYYRGGWHNAVVDTAFTDTPPFNKPANAPVPGSAVVLLEGKPTNVTFALSYDGARQQLPSQNPQSDATAYFHTVPVTVHLENSVGAGLSGADVTYYTNSWRTLGQTDAGGNAVLEVLPSKVTFAVSHLGSREQQTVNNVGTLGGAPVVFETVPVSVLLLDSGGAVIEGGTVTYYTNSWRPLGTTAVDGIASDPDIELLPSKVTFAVSYLGSRQQKTISNVADLGGAPVEFQTVLVTSGTATKFYTNSWQDFPTGSGVELLPTSKVSFRNAANQQWQVTVTGPSPQNVD